MQYFNYVCISQVIFTDFLRYFYRNRPKILNIGNVPHGDQHCAIHLMLCYALVLLIIYNCFANWCNGNTCKLEMLNAKRDANDGDKAD